MALSRFEVKYWDRDGVKRRVYAVADRYQEAEAAVALRDNDVDSSVLLEINTKHEVGVDWSSVRMVDEDD